MPEADKFTALGAGNGFPECLQRVDVSIFDYWTTYSGVNKNNPEATDSLIAESLMLAMELYWNVYEVKATCSATFTDSSNDPLPNESSTVTNADTLEHLRTKPKSRVCGFASGNETDSSMPSGRTNCFISLNSYVPIRIYNGVTTDEANFVGYGAGGGSILNSRAIASNRATARVTLFGYANTSNGSGVYDYAYVTINKINLLSEARATGDITTPNAANLTCSASASLGTTKDYTADATITGVEFYTYPAPVQP